MSGVGIQESALVGSDGRGSGRQVGFCGYGTFRLHCLELLASCHF